MLLLICRTKSVDKVNNHLFFKELSLGKSLEETARKLLVS